MLINRIQSRAVFASSRPLPNRYEHEFGLITVTTHYGPDGIPYLQRRRFSGLYTTVAKCRGTVITSRSRHSMSLCGLRINSRVAFMQQALLVVPDVPIVQVPRRFTRYEYVIE